MKTETFKLFQVDAFTSEIFKGNPAGVCLITKELPDRLLQNIAMEMNLSETAFPLPIDADSHSSAGHFKLRWFTSACEVPLCGHATLATSHVLFEEIGVSTDELKYDSLSGPLKAIREQGGIRLDFPLNTLEPADAPLELMRALCIGDYEAVEYCAKTEVVLVRVDSPETLLAVEPDFQAMLNSAAPWPVFAVIVTSAGRDGFDFFSRFFAPKVGVNEDPVTGMAHTMLADYWSRTLNKTEMRAYQASKRGGELIVRKVDDRVHIIGNAVTVFRTELEVPVP